MVETMCMEGHTVFVHTAASSLGIILNKIGSKEATGFNTYGSVDNKQAHFIREGLWWVRFFTDAA